MKSIYILIFCNLIWFAWFALTDKTNPAFDTSYIVANIYLAAGIVIKTIQKKDA